MIEDYDWGLWLKTIYDCCLWMLTVYAYMKQEPEVMRVNYQTYQRMKERAIKTTHFSAVGA